MKIKKIILVILFSVLVLSNQHIGLNLCLWRHKEQFSNKSSLRLEYFDEVVIEWKI